MRHQTNLPKSQQWKVEGSAELMKKLSPDLQIFLAAFDEGWAGNPSRELGKDERKPLVDSSNANRRDMMTIGHRSRDRVPMDFVEGLKGAATIGKVGDSKCRRVSASEFPTMMETQVKGSVDVCTRSNLNHVEDALIDMLDHSKSVKHAIRVIAIKRIICEEISASIEELSLHRITEMSVG